MNVSVALYYSKRQIIVIKKGHCLLVVIFSFINKSMFPIRLIVVANLVCNIYHKLCIYMGGTSEVETLLPLFSQTKCLLLHHILLIFPINAYFDRKVGV